MILPFVATPRRQFNLLDMNMWVELEKPTQIEMNDNQYSWFAHLMGRNALAFKDIPIVFLDAPQPHGPNRSNG